MLNLIRTIVILSMLLVVGYASGQSENSFDSAKGAWFEEFQTMKGKWKPSKVTIIDETNAKFKTRNNPNGRIIFYAINDQGKWEGYWVGGPNDSGCSQKKHGSSMWGVQIFQFNDTYDAYEGSWDMCGKGKKYPTKGTR